MDEDAIKDMIVRHEGVRPTAYLDTEGIWTVGIGHNLTVPLSHKAIMQIFADDLMEAKSACIHAFPWFADLTSERQAVMVDMCFNMGLHRLLGFKRMLTAIALGNYETAADEMLDSLWAKQVKSRALELAQLMRGSEPL